MEPSEINFELATLIASPDDDHTVCKQGGAVWMESDSGSVVFDPYHSIADAMRVVEKIVSVKGMSLIMEVCADHEEADEDAWKWEVLFGEVADGWYGADKSLPAAICLAAVEWAKAKKREVGE